MTDAKRHHAVVTDGESGRDLIWDALYTVAKRLNRSGRAGELEVRALRRRSWRRWEVVEGLWVGDNWPDVFEPVRCRRILGHRWQDLQPVQQAASKIGTFLRERPDLGRP